jgi:hypothetical protein
MASGHSLEYPYPPLDQRKDFGSSGYANPLFGLATGQSHFPEHRPEGLFLPFWPHYSYRTEPIVIREYPRTTGILVTCMALSTNWLDVPAGDGCLFSHQPWQLPGG